MSVTLMRMRIAIHAIRVSGGSGRLCTWGWNPNPYVLTLMRMRIEIHVIQVPGGSGRSCAWGWNPNLERIHGERFSNLGAVYTESRISPCTHNGLSGSP